MFCIVSKQATEILGFLHLTRVGFSCIVNKFKAGPKISYSNKPFDTLGSRRSAPSRCKSSFGFTINSTEVTLLLFAIAAIFIFFNNLQIDFGTLIKDLTMNEVIKGKNESNFMLKK